MISKLKRIISYSTIHINDVIVERYSGTVLSHFYINRNFNLISFTYEFIGLTSLGFKIIFIDFSYARSTDLCFRRY